MAQRKTPSVAYSEYVSPDPEASGQAWLARLQLMNTVKRVFPKFLEKLLAEVFPLYQQLKKEGHDFEKNLWRRVSPYERLPENCGLKLALSQWAAEFNADIDWLMDEALRTLRLWDVSSDSRESLEWNSIPSGGRPLGMGDAFEFRCEGWETTFLTWPAYSESVRRRFEAQLSNYEKQTRELAEKKGLVRARRTYSPDNLEWFVLFQFAGMSSRDIVKLLANKSIHVEDSAVLKGIKAASTLIGWGNLLESKQTRRRKVR